MVGAVKNGSVDVGGCGGFWVRCVCCVDEGRQFEMQPGLEGDLPAVRIVAEQCPGAGGPCVVLDRRPVCQSLGAGRQDFGVERYCM